jgi:hypothetical protein
LVQPIRDSQRRQPCRRGHYFVQIADRDHVFFEYAPRNVRSLGLTRTRRRRIGSYQAMASSATPAAGAQSASAR